LFAEKKLDHFVTSRCNSNIEKTVSRHRDANPTINCYVMDMSPARTAANDAVYSQLPCAFSDSGSVSPACSSLLNVSEPKAESGSEAVDASSPDEISCTDRQEKCSANFRKKVDMHVVDDYVINTCVHDSERDVIEIDSNCNKVLTNDWKHDVNVSPCSIKDVYSVENYTLPESHHCVAVDGMSQSLTLLRSADVINDSLQDPSAVLTV